MNKEDFITFAIDNFEELVSDVDDLYATFQFLYQIKEPWRTQVVAAIANKGNHLLDKPVKQSDIDDLKEEFVDQVEGIEQYFDL